MIINLHEIPEEGKTWSLTNKTGELNTVLKDIIGENPYHTEFTIRPLTQGQFELFGTIKAQHPEQCSRCGIDFNFLVNEQFKELLIPKVPSQKHGETYVKTNHYTDLSNEGPSVSEYEGHQFDIGEYLHEMVGLAEEFSPAPPPDDNGDCSVCKIPLKNHAFNYDEPMEKDESPFAALKKIKIQ
ncbi:MAG: hypothetical protein BroJett041_24010 [Candidatus Jettenia caeni]|nr:MAG: hypothetical protein BroJett041_24010 [Candidatus Jettenia caeni]